MRLALLIAALLLQATAGPAEAAPTASATGAPESSPAASMSQVFGAALNGDMTKALSILDSVDRTKLTPKDSVTADCMRRTFAAPPSPEDLPPKSAAVLTAYRTYWQSVMLHKSNAGDAEGLLLGALNACLTSGPADTARAAGLDVASDRAKAAIEKEGLHALTGVTSPYWELMIWRVEDPKTYHVKLPERAIDVRVVFIDDFVSFGWAGYATCGRAHTGGWATSDALYSLRSSYDTASEDFRVSYLAHEGRHFSDYREFPRLEQPELEYRAKLTEIALSSETTLKLITAFSQQTGHDRAVPHSFADYCVARDLSRAVFRSEEGVGDPTKWKSVAPERIRREALKLLKANDERLRRMGAKDVRQFLEVSAQG